MFLTVLQCFCTTHNHLCTTNSSYALNSSPIPLWRKTRLSFIAFLTKITSFTVRKPDASEIQDGRFHTLMMNNWRLQWKKGGRFFTQNWTSPETLQISHVVLIRCVKECFVCFLAEVCLVFKILCMQKTCILWLRQHVTAKTVISLKIKQNIDLLQHATLKKCSFQVKKN